MFVLMLALCLVLVSLSGFGHRPVAAQQNDAGSGGDAGNTDETAVQVELNQQYNGQVDSSTDNEDWYKYYVNEGQTVTQIIVNYTWSGSLDDAQTIEIGGTILKLKTPIDFSCDYPGGFASSSPNVGAENSGTVELIEYPYAAISAGYCNFKVSCEDGTASYTFKIEVTGESTSGQQVELPPTSGGDHALPLLVTVVIVVVIISVLGYMYLRKSKETLGTPEIPSIS